MKKILTFYVGLSFITFSYAQNENPNAKSTSSNKVVTPANKNIQTTTVKSSTTKEINGVKYQRLDSKPISGSDPNFIKNQSKNNANQPSNSK